MKFTRSEITDLTKAWCVVSLVFSIASVGVLDIFKPSFGTVFLISAITVGSGFLLHELAHKAVAQHFKCTAVFQSYTAMLWISLLLSLTGFVFVAPGGVMIQGALTPRKNGLIALAGPVTNMLLAIVFGLLKNLLGLGMIGGYGAMINAWLALFNLIPFGPLDGQKVFAWNKGIYALALVIAGILVYF